MKAKIVLSWLKSRTEIWETVIPGKRLSPGTANRDLHRVYLSPMRTVWLIYIVEFGTLDFFHDLKVVLKTLPIGCSLPVTPFLFEVNKPEAECPRSVIVLKKNWAILVDRKKSIYHLLLTSVVGTLHTLSQ